MRRHPKTPAKKLAYAKQYHYDRRLADDIGIPIQELRARGLQGERVHYILGVRLTEETIRKIDAWMKGPGGPRSRGEAVRKLVDMVFAEY
jgi:hypothetical protein